MLVCVEKDVHVNVNVNINLNVDADADVDVLWMCSPSHKGHDNTYTCVSRK